VKPADLIGTERVALDLLQACGREPAISGRGEVGFGPEGPIVTPDSPTCRWRSLNRQPTNLNAP